MQPSDRAMEPNRPDDREGRQLARTLFWAGFGVGVAALGAVLAYTAVRLASARREDPTSQRIQQLIDEANSLLKALDEQRHSA
jgi:hypothetical protein